MHKKLLLAGCALILNVQAFAQITPEIYSWVLNTTGATGYNNISSNIQQVQYSTGNVYVSASCIPGYSIGPWAGNPNTPANQNFVYKITRNPVQNTGTAINTGLGHIGVWINGVSIFNPRDGMSYNNQNVWHQNAIVVEGPSFDNCLGHPAPNGEYHHHLNPTCLYNDSLTTVHSPIIGWAFDGFPVYGAYGYANTNGTGGIARMQSSYHPRSITTRVTLPNGTTASSPGPVVSAMYPLGYYVEDFEYIAGSGDLDEHNGRFCITPDYPLGKYCYFVTLDSNLVAAYPYTVGLTYYGTVPAGNTGPTGGHNTITEPVTIYTGSTAINQLDDAVNFSMFPNPASKYLVLMIEKNSPANTRLEIINSLGQIVLKQDNIQPAVQYVFDIAAYSNGVYYSRLINGNSVTVNKLIVEK
jgi:YHYH protein/Secretion system C-terminal sorting domain